MITIEYCKNGLYLPDHEMDGWVEETINNHKNNKHDIVDKVSNELIIHCFRTKIVQQKINHTDIRFLYKDKYLYPNKDGRLLKWPKGFCDHMDNYLDILIGI